MSTKNKVDSVLGLIAGMFLSILGKRRRKVNVNDLQMSEFRTSTQRMGIRFTDRLRNVFRLGWIKKRKV